MSQQAVRVIKSVDAVEQKCGTIRPDDRDFWIEQRHALLMQLASIERKLGIQRRRCTHCKTSVPVTQSG